jgi:hypothetical protein
MTGIFSKIQSPALLQLYNYWDSRREGRNYPSRRHLDPTDFPYALGKVFLVDVLCEPLRFQYRLFGTHLVDCARYDLTGKLAEDIPSPEMREFFQESYGLVIKHREPFHSIGERILDGHTHRFEVALMPLSNNGRKIDMILGYLQYSDPVL